MKSRDTLIRLKRFQAEDRRKRVAQIEMMIAEFTRMGGDLDREIATEEQRSGNANPSHFAYSTYARAARTRRDNLKNSTDELRGQVEEAKARLAEALDVGDGDGLMRLRRVRGDRCAVVAEVDIGLEAGDSLAGDAGSLEAADKLLGFAGEHGADDEFETAGVLGSHLVMVVRWGRWNFGQKLWGWMGADG